MDIGRYIAMVAPNSNLSLQFPPKSTFDPAGDIDDLTGKVIIVTGGNSGIGYHTVKALLLKNARVYLAARSPDRCRDAIRRLEDETGGKVPILLELDLADLRSVRKAAEVFLRNEERLDILFNNAGVMTPPTDHLTAQGYDLQFGTNVLGHYLFTKLLLPAMQRSKEYHGVKARIINTSSSVHDLAPGTTGIDWTVVKGGTARDASIKLWGDFQAKWKLYGASKMGNIFVSKILVRYHGDFVISCALHPGGLQTDLQQHLPGWQQFLINLILYPAPYGALTQLWAGTASTPESVDGQYLIPWARIGKPDPRCDNESTQLELYTWLEEQISGY